MALVAAHDAFRLKVLALEYTVVEKFHCQWMREKTDPREPAFHHVSTLRHSSSDFPLNQSFSDAEIVELVRGGKMRGLIHAKISIPPNKRLEFVFLPCVTSREGEQEGYPPPGPSREGPSREGQRDSFFSPPHWHHHSPISF